MWQDYVFATGTVLFSVALVPAIFSRAKPPLSTSLLTAGVLATFLPAYITLHLWFSTLAAIVNGLFWVILAFQRHVMLKQGTNDDK